MAASTESMCLRSDSLAVYSRISARVSEREGRALESVISFRVDLACACCHSQEIYDSLPQISALGQCLQHHPRDVDSQLEQQQSAEHYRNVDPRLFSRRQRSRVKEPADHNHR